MKGSPLSRSVNWRSLAAAATLTLCLTPAVTGPTGAHADVLHASPALLHDGAAHPGTMVKVIVQKHGQTTLPEGMIQAAGGKITKHLSIINAVAATVPGRALHSIAASNSVNWLSADAPVHREGVVSTTNLLNKYDGAVLAPNLWNKNDGGSGVNVAVVDSGVNVTPDFGSRIVASVAINGNTTTTADNFGHGTHVAGIIAGDGTPLGGQYIGIAPKAGIVNVKVFDDSGAGTMSDVVNGLQWIYNNRATYNIKVVNLSLDSTVAQSYNNDPLDAACEILWFNKITVVAAAGNSQSTNPGVLYSPANDPFVITVGAVNDNYSTSDNDDTVASFSAYGTTTDGFAKPDVVAPGVDIVAPLASATDMLATQHPSHVVSTNYFDMSGTSMATGAVSGAAALLLSTYPTATPDQIKYALMNTTTRLASPTGSGKGEVNANSSLNSWSGRSANTGLTPSSALQTGTGTGFVTWDSASWGSASWGSVSWGSASWGSASWGSASWGSDYWGSTKRHPMGNTSKSDTSPNFVG